MKPKHLPEVHHTAGGQAHRFLPDKFFPRLIYGSSRTRAFLLSLNPGQGLAPRKDSEEMICYLIEGRARLTIGEDQFEISAGDLAAASPGQVRGIQALARCLALWVHVSPGQVNHG